MVFQEGALFDSLSVYDNVAFRLHERQVPEDEIENEVRLLLRFVDLEDDIDKLPAELSGGMKKRVSIARALCGNPKLVLYDEPTVSLDPLSTAKICELIAKLRDLDDISSVLVTHEMDVVQYLTSEYADVSDTGKVHIRREGNELCLMNTTVLMLRGGRVIFDGNIRHFAGSKDPYIQEFIRGTEIDSVRIAHAGR